MAILFVLEKYAFFKIAFLSQKNVHFVLNILFRRWKLFLAFLDFYFYLFRIFSVEFIKKKKSRARLGQRPSQAGPSPTSAAAYHSRASAGLPPESGSASASVPLAQATPSRPL